MYSTNYDNNNYKNQSTIIPRKSRPSLHKISVRNYIIKPCVNLTQIKIHYKYVKNSERYQDMNGFSSEQLFKNKEFKQNIKFFLNTL